MPVQSMQADEPSRANRQMMIDPAQNNMAEIAANTFERQYRSHAGVDDHKHTAALLHKIQKNGEDADLKAPAGKLLPTAQQHLKVEKQLAFNNKILSRA